MLGKYQAEGDEEEASITPIQDWWGGGDGSNAEAHSGENETNLVHGYFLLSGFLRALPLSG